ncbi:hypothetical protein C8J57DRAFT_296341 [Mycena rebaudengoi]|nr:hypothetical protein C8J57DRAFT_296341 [Mycena rebaudengoi]
MVVQRLPPNGVCLTPARAACSRPLELQATAVRLCIALQSELDLSFLDAANELLSWGKLPAADFHRHSRKIIRLIETARENLEDSGISLYLFTHASCQKRKYKDIYLDLLRMLQVRRGDVDVTLKVRMNSLLFRLSNNFIEQGATDEQIPSARLTLPQRNRDAQTQGSISACIQPPPPQPLNSTAPCISMPPPDAFPPGSACRRRKRRKSTSKPGPLWVPEMEKLVRHKRVRCEAEQENQVPACVPSTATYTYKPAPLTKRFGIFCTGKNSMHRRSGHPTPVKAY